MTDATASSMDALAIDAFLEAQQVGVLALADDGNPYAIPMSFAYGPEDRSIYLRLGYAPGSQKRRYVAATDGVRFVVYDDTAEGWKSVVVEGHLEEVTADSLSSSIREAVEDLEIPVFAVFDRPTEEVEFHVGRIEVSGMTGIEAGSRLGGGA